MQQPKVVVRSMQTILYLPSLEQTISSTIQQTGEAVQSPHMVIMSLTSVEPAASSTTERELLQTNIAQLARSAHWIKCTHSCIVCMLLLCLKTVTILFIQTACCCSNSYIFIAIAQGWFKACCMAQHASFVQEMASLPLLTCLPTVDAVYQLPLL